MDTHAVIIALLLHAHFAHSLWSCRQNSDCSFLSDGLCVDGGCVCEPGQQAVLGGSACRNAAPYIESICVEDFQCSGLLTGFHCRKNANSTEGNCVCRPGYHYFRGRCWRSVPFDEPCSWSEECMSAVPDPFRLQCNGTCQCADGYFERQKGDCRRAVTAVGESCVLNNDCQFPDGVCDPTALVCIINGTDITTGNPIQNMDRQTHTAISRVPCDATRPCVSPFVCSALGACVCPRGYYESSNGGCLAELGFPSTADQCVGFLAEVIDGICTCRNNFFYDANMKDCVKVCRNKNDACINDVMCYSFGPARCGPPAEPWGLRSCECVDSVWDDSINACRYFSGIGESCQVDGDCMAGERVIECVEDEDGNGVCACPEDSEEYEGLCLNMGLELGESCQLSAECSARNSECAAGACACSAGYQQRETGNGTICASALGGSCVSDGDCVTEESVCMSYDNSSTCHCREGFAGHEDACWPKTKEYNGSCTVTAQCTFQRSECDSGRCVCETGHHFRDSNCWPMSGKTFCCGGLFYSCTRSSECYLAGGSERAVCRNSICQCSFEYPYSEELNTCTSTAGSHEAVSIFIIIAISLFSLVLK